MIAVEETSTAAGRGLNAVGKVKGKKGNEEKRKEKEERGKRGTSLEAGRRDWKPDLRSVR